MGAGERGKYWGEGEGQIFLRVRFSGPSEEFSHTSALALCRP